MNRASAIYSVTDVHLTPNPLDPSSIIEGTPLARSATLTRSADQTAFTMVWDCSAGVFRWYYSFDETLHVLEGSALIDDGHSPPRMIGPGDVVFFPAGATAVWRVDRYIRKVAFCRKALPAPIGAVLRALRGAKKALRPSRPAAVMGA
jgi:uncharacterized cupin superfamily protein